MLSSGARHLAESKAGGGETPDFSRLALGLVLSCDATVGDDGSVVGDPTEAAFVVLAAKTGVSAATHRPRGCPAF